MSATGSTDNSRYSSTTSFESPSNSTQIDELQNRLKDLGNTLYKERKFDEAVRAYTDAINLDPLADSAAAIYANRALCHQTSGNFLDAFADGSAAAALKPDWPRGFERRTVAAESIARTPPFDEATFVMSPYTFARDTEHPERQRSWFSVAADSLAEVLRLDDTSDAKKKDERTKKLAELRKMAKALRDSDAELQRMVKEQHAEVTKHGKGSKQRTAALARLVYIAANRDSLLGFQLAVEAGVELLKFRCDEHMKCMSPYKTLLLSAALTQNDLLSLEVIDFLMQKTLEAHATLVAKSNKGSGKKLALRDNVFLVGAYAPMDTALCGGSRGDYPRADMLHRLLQTGKYTPSDLDGAVLGNGDEWRPQCALLLMLDEGKKEPHQIEAVRECTHLLLCFGANPRGDTRTIELFESVGPPLNLAASHSGYAEVCRLLLLHGADVNCVGAVRYDPDFREIDEEDDDVPDDAPDESVDPNWRSKAESKRKLRVSKEVGRDGSEYRMNPLEASLFWAKDVDTFRLLVAHRAKFTFRVSKKKGIRMAAPFFLRMLMRAPKKFLAEPNLPQLPIFPHGVTVDTSAFTADREKDAAAHAYTPELLRCAFEEHLRQGLTLSYIDHAHTGRVVPLLGLLLLNISSVTSASAEDSKNYFTALQVLTEPQFAKDQQFMSDGEPLFTFFSKSKSKLDAPLTSLIRYFENGRLKKYFFNERFIDLIVESVHHADAAVTAIAFRGPSRALDQLTQELGELNHFLFEWGKALYTPMIQALATAEASKTAPAHPAFCCLKAALVRLHANPAPRAAWTAFEGQFKLLTNGERVDFAKDVICRFVPASMLRESTMVSLFMMLFNQTEKYPEVRSVYLRFLANSLMRTENVEQVLYWITVRDDEIGNFIVKKFEYKLATSLVTALFTRRFPTLCRDEAIRIWSEEVHDSLTFVRASKVVCAHLFAYVDDGKPLRPGPKELEALRDESIMKAQIAAMKRITNPTVEAVNRFLIDMNMIFASHLPSDELADFLRNVAFPLANSSKNLQLIRSCYVIIVATITGISEFPDSAQPRALDIITKQLGVGEAVKLVRFVLDDRSESADEVICRFWNCVHGVMIVMSAVLALYSKKTPVPLADCESLFKWFVNTLSPHQTLLQSAFKKLIQLYNSKQRDSEKVFDQVVEYSAALAKDIDNPKLASINSSISAVISLYDSIFCVAEFPAALLHMLKQIVHREGKAAARAGVWLCSVLMIMPQGLAVFKDGPNVELAKISFSVASG